jgi:predicted membrane channel-forming protein YqfA (hemolysin III family)
MRPEDSKMTGSATGPQTEEHRKTGRAGYLVLGWCVVFMAITVLSFALGYSAIWWTTAGICVALFIVGILLVLESERQRQRRDKVVSRRLWPWNVRRHR